MACHSLYNNGASYNKWCLWRGEVGYIYEGSWGAVLVMIRSLGGGWNLGIPQVCLRCVQLPGTWVYTEVSHRKLKEQGGGLAIPWRDLPGFGVHLLSLPFLGRRLMVPVGRPQVGATLPGGRGGRAFPVLSSESLLSLKDFSWPTGVSEVHAPGDFGSFQARILRPEPRAKQERTISLTLHDPKWQFRKKVTPPPNHPHFAQGSCLPSCAVRMGSGSKIGVVGRWWRRKLASCCCFEGDLMWRNQRNEWFASFEKAPSGFRFHIYYFQPFQLDPWGFPGLPGGAALQASLPFFPSPGTNVCFSHIFITAQAFRKDRGAALTWEPGVCLASV